MKKSLFVELLELLELEMGSGNWEYVLLSRRKFYTEADFPPGGGGGLFLHVGRIICQAHFYLR